MAATYTTDAFDSGLAVEGFYPGKVYCRSARYTAGSASTANDIVKMMKIPDDARLLRIDWHSSATIAGTFDVGNGDDVDAYIDGADPSSNTTGSQILDEQTDGEVDLQVKFLTAAPAENGTFTLHVYYKMAKEIDDEDLD